MNDKSESVFMTASMCMKKWIEELRQGKPYNLFLSENMEMGDQFSDFNMHSSSILLGTAR